MVNVTEKLAPGGEVPWGECEQCGAFVYLDDLGARPRMDTMVRERPLSYSASRREPCVSPQAIPPVPEDWAYT